MGDPSGGILVRRTTAVVGTTQRWGYITTSNEMNLPAHYPNGERKLGFEWANRSRHTRIDEVLHSLAKVSIEDSLALQNDVVSLPARRLVAVLSSLNTDDATAKRALNLLRDWDGVERAESPQAALMEVWMSSHLDEAFRSAVLPSHAAAAFTSADVAVMLDALEKPAMRFVGDSKGSATEKRNKVLLESLRSAYLEMEKLQGADASKWQWGMLHHSLPEHGRQCCGHGASQHPAAGPVPERGQCLHAECVSVSGERFSPDQWSVVSHGPRRGELG